MPFSLFGISSYSFNLTAISIKFTFLLLVLLLISSVVLHHISNEKFFQIINFLYFHPNLYMYSMFFLTSYGRFLSYYYYTVYSLFFASHTLRLVFQVGNVLNILKANKKKWNLNFGLISTRQQQLRKQQNLLNIIHMLNFYAYWGFSQWNSPLNQINVITSSLNASVWILTIRIYMHT